MGVFEAMDERAKELAARLRDIYERRDQLLADARGRIDTTLDEVRTQLDQLGADARRDLDAFQVKAEAELREVRTRMADFIDPDRARGRSDEQPPTDPTPPPPPAPEPGPDGEASMGHA